MTRKLDSSFVCLKIVAIQMKCKKEITAIRKRYAFFAKKILQKIDIYSGNTL